MDSIKMTGTEKWSSIKMTGTEKWSNINVRIDGLPEASTGMGGHFLE